MPKFEKCQKCGSKGGDSEVGDSDTDIAGGFGRSLYIYQDQNVKGKAIEWDQFDRWNGNLDTYP